MTKINRPTTVKAVKSYFYQHFFPGDGGESRARVAICHTVDIEIIVAALQPKLTWEDYDKGATMIFQVTKDAIQCADPERVGWMLESHEHINVLEYALAIKAHPIFAPFQNINIDCVYDYIRTTANERPPPW